MYLDYGSLLTSLRLDFDEDVHQRYRCRGYAGDAGSMSEGARTNSDQYFLDLAGKAADGTVVEPLRDGALFGFLEAVDGSLLLQKVAFVFDFGFHRFELVAECGRNTGHGFARIYTDFIFIEELWGEFTEQWDQALDRNFGALKQLSQALANG
jgi:hypothetical protein